MLQSMELQRVRHDLETEKQQQRHSKIISKVSTPLLLCFDLIIKENKNYLRDFPSSSVVKTPCFQCKGHKFHPWSGN